MRLPRIARVMLGVVTPIYGSAMRLPLSRAMIQPCHTRANVFILSDGTCHSCEFRFSSSMITCAKINACWLFTLATPGVDNYLTMFATHLNFTVAVLRASQPKINVFFSSAMRLPNAPAMISVCWRLHYPVCLPSFFLVWYVN